MTKYVFADHIPDLIEPGEYATDPDGKRVRVRIRWTEDGVELVGDSLRPRDLERLLEEFGFDEIEQMLCG